MNLHQLDVKHGPLLEWQNGMGNIVLPIPAEQVDRVAVPASANRPAAEILAGILAEQLDELGADAIRDELEEHGAWNDAELADDAENRIRLVWLAAWNLQDEAAQ